MGKEGINSFHSNTIIYANIWEPTVKTIVATYNDFVKGNIIKGTQIYSTFVRFKLVKLNVAVG